MALQPGLFAPNGSVPWYAIQVRPRHEKLVATLLAQKGYQTLLPLHRMRRSWSDRIAAVELPLFSGYVFCECNLNDRRVPILTTPGVIRVVGTGRVPRPIDEKEVEAIRRVMESGTAVEPFEYLHSGTHVRIEGGALAGIEGIVVEHKSKRRLVISVSLLQRSVAVEIDGAWLTPLAATASV